MSTAITLDNVTLGYERHPAIHHLSGTVEAGDLLAVIGPNGAGKSTLLKGLAGLLRPIQGRIVLAGRRRDIAYLPQRSQVDRSFPLSLFDFVAMGGWRRTGWLRRIGASEQARIADAIAAVGLTGFEGRIIATLSGGQMQRALFARLLLQDAPLVLLDEPFTAIDEATARDLTAMILRWHGEGRTVIAVLHDMDLVRAHFLHTLVLAREQIAWGPTGEILARPDPMAAAHKMMEAWDEHAAVCGRQAA